jgi:predicted O-linked N-acetylglucosamine transferase (SPINDLY family)
MNKIGRNDPCLCGSGKKYKQCCMRQTDSQPIEETKPPLPSAQLLHLALIQHMSGKLDEAEAVYRDVLKREPRNAAAWHLTGVAAGDRGNLAKAIELIEKAIALDDGNHSFHANLGRMLSLSDRTAEAETAYRRALALNPDRAYYDSLANTLCRQDRYAEAEECYRRALALDPQFAGAYRNFGDLLQVQGRHTEAFEQYERALALMPESADLHSNIGTLRQSEGDYAAAIDCFRKSLAYSPDNRNVQDNLIYTQSFHCSPADYFQAARSHGEELIQRALAQPVAGGPRREPRADAASKLRIGFVSGDLRSHPVGIFLESILAQLSKNSPADGIALELIAYATVPPVDAVTERIRPCFTTWRTIDKISDAEAVRQIRDDRIDILVDLNGYTANNRLEIFAWKAAPVQVTWLGYWASTGLPNIDYILADRYSLPPEEAVYYSENPWYLPDSRLCFTPPRDAGEVAPPPSLKNGYITFGCFNNPTKINDDVVASWARILQRLPDARLLLKAKQFVDEAFSARMRARFAAHDIDPARILLQPETPRAEYFAAYNEIDIALDPFPYTGATTSIDGLWMGVPLITLRGDRMVGHQGESILHNLGLTDWIARDGADYEEIALRQSADPQRLAALRSELRTRLTSSPLCDAARFAQHLREAFASMWQTYLDSGQQK